MKDNNITYIIYTIMAKQNGVASSILYKSLERYSTMAFQLIVQIVIARILAPEDFGVVAMMTVFINVAGVFIYNGFNMAVIQKKDADEKDFCTALSVNLFVGILLYLVFFACAPLIAAFYKQNDLNVCLRVLALILPIGSVYSIQSAILSRFMQYDKLFICNFGGSVVSGILGVITALMGLGFWALIIQQLSNIIVATILISIKTEIRLKLLFVANSAREMFAFGWKLLVAGLINAIYGELNSLVIGKKYSSADLAFFTKGKTFPNALASGLDSALQSVMLSSMSRKQDDYSELRLLMRKAMVSNTYLIMPLMALLAICAKPFTLFLLTEKWLPLVPYMQITCLTVAFHPIGTINIQALAAIGRSDVRLKLEFIKKPVGLVLLLLSLNYGPMAIAISVAITSFFSFGIGLVACQKYINYSAVRACKAVLPAFLLSCFVGLICYWFIFWDVNPLIILLSQVFAYVILYISLSRLFSLEGLSFVKQKTLDIVPMWMKNIINRFL